MSERDPVQNTTYYLYPYLNRWNVPIDTPNPLTFGPGTDISVSKGDAVVNSQSDAGALVAWTITNKGKISSSAATGGGISLLDGGTVINDANASIRSSGIGVEIGGSAAGTVTNYGIIYGSVGVEDGYGSVINKSGGIIHGTGTTGVYIYGTCTVTNAGDIYGPADGVQLGVGGSVINQSGGTIQGNSVESLSPTPLSAGPVRSPMQAQSAEPRRSRSPTLARTR